MTNIQMMNNLAVDGKITASGDVEDGAGNTLANMVTLGTAQTITGAKTFVRAFTVQSGVSSVITLKNTTFDKNAVASAYRSPLQINGLDANENTYFSINYEARATDTRVLTISCRSETKNGTFRVFTNESAQWAQVSYRAYASANVDDVVTIGSLASNPNVLHSTGNETKTGNLTVTGMFTTTNNLNVRKAQPRTSLTDTATDINAGTITAGDRGFFALYDNSGSIIGDLIISIDSSGKASIRARARNADGTTRQAVLI